MQDMPADVFQLDSMSSIVHAVDMLPAGHQAYNLLKSDLTVSDEVKLQCPTPSTLPSEQSNGANVSPNITSPRAAVSISSPRFCKGRGVLYIVNIVLHFPSALQLTRLLGGRILRSKGTNKR